MRLAVLSITLTVDSPTVARGEERLRITPTPGHTPEQQGALVEALLSVWAELGLKTQSDWVREGGRAGVGGKAVEQLWTPEQLGLGNKAGGARFVPDAGSARVQPHAL